ncbi:hypothetical protein CBL_05271 [Carabus blaptoides fortunei]
MLHVRANGIENKYGSKYFHVCNLLDKHISPVSRNKYKNYARPSPVALYVSIREYSTHRNSTESRTRSRRTSGYVPFIFFCLLAAFFHSMMPLASALSSAATAKDYYGMRG